MQLKGKLINWTWENAKKPNFGLDFDPFWPKFGPKNVFLWVLPLPDVIHCCKLSMYAISRKTNNQKWENGKKPSFRPDFGHFGPNMAPKLFVNFTSTRS